MATWRLHALLAKQLPNFCLVAAALEALSLGGGDTPLLLRLPSRPWGAAATLSADEVKAATGTLARKPQPTRHILGIQHAGLALM